MALPSRISGLLLDLDGVFYVGDQAISGAAEALSFLHNRGIPCRFTTNTTTRSVGSLHQKLREMGLPIEREEMFTVIDAAKAYLRSLGDPVCHFLLSDEPLTDFAEFKKSNTEPDLIVVGDVGKQWSYDLMNKMFNFMVSGAGLVALHKGRYWQVEAGLRMDIGAFVAGLEYVTGKTATVIGKPSGTFFDMALQNLKVSKDQVAMIGDDIFNDIGGAQAAGIAGILVKTGKYRPELIRDSRVIPDGLLDSIADVPSLFT